MELDELSNTKSMQHFKSLESMYGAAPINQIYNPSIEISEGQAIIEIALTTQFYHSAGAVHGSVYFKLPDDAAFFAAQSFELDFFILTTSFTTYLTRPVSSGRMRAVGKVAYQNKTQFIAESVVYDSNNNETGRGNGMFVRGKLALNQALGYEK